jgi:hypothetical protein
VVTPIVVAVAACRLVLPVTVSPCWIVAPFDALNTDVDALPVTARFVVVALVVVESMLVKFITVLDPCARMPDWNVCSAVHVLAFPRFRLATTAPFVGLIVRVESVFVTEFTVHVPLTAKHPAVRFTPLANVDDAVVDRMFNALMFNPPPKVEVPAPFALNTPEIVVEPLVVSTVKTDELAAFRMLNALVELMYDCNFASVDVP